MMLAILLALFAAPQLEISLAPDQPVPTIYADDPLILQLKSNEDVTVRGTIEFTRDDGRTSAIDLPEIALRADQNHWQPLDGAPADRGRFATRVSLDLGGVPVALDLVFCRIDRPSPEVASRLGVRVESIDERTLFAWNGVPIRDLVIPVNLPDLHAKVQQALAAGCAITFAVDSGESFTREQAEALGNAFNDKISSWVVRATEDPAALSAAEENIRRASRAPIGAVITNDAEIESMFTPPGGRDIAAIVIEDPELSRSRVAAVRARIESAGYESFPLHAFVGNRQADNPASGHQLVRDLLLLSTMRVDRVVLPPDIIYGRNGIGETYVPLSAMAHRLNGSSCVGELPLAPPLYAPVFRAGNTWIIAIWTTGSPKELDLEIGEAEGVALADPRNNALPLPAITNGTIRLPVDDAPKFLSGSGGVVLARAARHAARRDAEVFLGRKDFQKDLSPDLIEVVKVIASALERPDRLNFFALLRTFPVLEQQWHEERLRRDVAVPAMASIARMLRALCIVEQESGVPFIELLQETIARCGEYQSQYLTGTGGATESHDRADWLSAEIARLTAEAKALADEGRSIEAVGLGSLAEWRARSLEFAVAAKPLGTPEQARVEEEPAPRRGRRSDSRRPG